MSGPQFITQFPLMSYSQICILQHQLTSTDTINLCNHKLQFWPRIFIICIRIKLVNWCCLPFWIYTRLLGCINGSIWWFTNRSRTNVQEIITNGYDYGRLPHITFVHKSAYFICYVLVVHDSIQDHEYQLV